MSEATTVFLVRHGAHDRLDRMLTGRMPGVSLGEQGRAEARRTATRLAREKIAALYTSPLERARETAAPLGEALRLEPVVTEALHEIDCGEWTGATFDTLHADERWHHWNRERAEGCPPGGEPMADVQERAAGAVEAWRQAHPGQAVVAVTHSDVIKTVVCRFLGLSLDRYHAFEIEPASVTTLVAWSGGGKVIRLNEVPGQ